LDVDQDHESPLNTDRIARIVVDALGYGLVVRSVPQPFITRAGGFIARNLQIATAD
jgi:hypothetical protein